MELILYSAHGSGMGDAARGDEKSRADYQAASVGDRECYCVKESQRAFRKHKQSHPAHQTTSMRISEQRAFSYCYLFSLWETGFVSGDDQQVRLPTPNGLAPKC